uniref:Ras of Complex, Roc, domain of DAPkinase n=1 Tax=Candidatus Kentrum sp. SD TaxID=2126332 RepID=A0A451BPG8_9GAMM|nr:MAG: Ras of Complex, Roc, domain of DAPkinase [Candidatus Kentron sp. SD]
MRLRELDNPRLSVAFAARVALTALPVLTYWAEEESFLWYWKEGEREGHLLSVFRALEVCWAVPLEAGLISRARARAAEAVVAAEAAAAADVYVAAYADAYAAADAAYAADAAVAYAAAYAADAATYAAAADTATYAAAADAATYAAAADTATYAAAADTATYAAAAADAAAYAAAAADAYASAINFIRRELDTLSPHTELLHYLARGCEDSPLGSLQDEFLSRVRAIPSFEYWADWFEARSAGKPADPSILEASILLPEEIEVQGPRVINRYLADLAGGRRGEKIKRVRAIFIGSGEAGKTSLIRALNHASVAGNTGMTRGIEMSEWPVPDTDLTAHFWDFGGQIIAHATHLFFLRVRCVYVLVLNARSADSNPNQQAEYWLEFARVFGNGAPVLVVENKCDLARGLVDFSRLRKNYPDIRGFYELSATGYQDRYAREFGIFRDAFINELVRAGEKTRLYFSRSEFELIEELRKKSRKAAFLEKSAFDGLCAAHGIGEGETRERFLTLLDQLGKVIWFPEFYRAGFGAFLLKPRWLTHGVYRVIYSDTLREAEGVLRWNDLRDILWGESITDEQGNRLDYPEEKLGFLVRAMERFKLCYPAPDAPSTWIVPGLLPSDEPEGIVFDGREVLRFEFRFETFLPRYVLGMFMVEHYRDIRKGRAWQHGAYFASQRWKDTGALIRADYQKRVLSLAVNGVFMDRYFPVLYDTILEILDRMPKLKYAKCLHLIEAARIGGVWRVGEPEEAFADFEDLLALEAKGRRVYECKFGEYDLERLLRPLPKGRAGPGTEAARHESTGDGDNEQGAPGWGLMERIVISLGAAGSLIAGLIPLIESDDKLFGGVIGVVVASAVIIATLSIRRWYRKSRDARQER